uniref:Uncharacterized protein n=1 Tax=Panagrolaimus sp. ES5 TaxID=591445 RepID=A0AC34FT66_9BILA
MNSSSIAPTAAALNQESVNKNSKTILSKRASFFASYRRDQNFAFPDSIMFYISQNPPSAKNFPLIVPKIYQSNVKELTLREQIISFNDLIFLASKCKTIHFWRGANVVDKEGCVVPLEKIVEVLPKLTFIFYALRDPKSISKKTVKELLQLPHFTNLINLVLLEIPETFDIDTFYDFIKTNMKTRICLNFSDQVSEEHKNRVQAIKDEIDQTENRNYVNPFIRLD